MAVEGISGAVDYNREMTVADLTSHPLCQYFLSDYLANHNDPTNIPPAEVPAIF